MREVIDALAAIGTEANWITEEDFTAIIERTGSTRKYLRLSINRVNQWLAHLPQTLEKHGRIHPQGIMRDERLLRGGVTTALILAGDATALAPMALSNALLAGTRCVVKGSSVEPLAPFLFLKAVLSKGIQAPQLLFLNSTSEEERQWVLELINKTQQSVIYGEDQTVERIYQAASPGPAHKTISYWSGRSGVLVLADADIRVAARCIVQGVGEDRGNRCISTKKVYAPSFMRSELERMIVEEANLLRRGDPQEGETEVGKLDPQIRAAVLSAAVDADIFYDRDLIFAHAQDDSPLIKEEHPYPVCGIRWYEQDEDPIALINRSTAHGPAKHTLSLSVITQGTALAESKFTQLDAYKLLRNLPSTHMDHATPHQGMHLFLELMRPMAFVG